MLKKVENFYLCIFYKWWFFHILNFVRIYKKMGAYQKSHWLVKKLSTLRGLNFYLPGSWWQVYLPDPVHIFEIFFHLFYNDYTIYLQSISTCLKLEIVLCVNKSNDYLFLYIRNLCSKSFFFCTQNSFKFVWACVKYKMNIV